MARILSDGPKTFCREAVDSACLQDFGEHHLFSNLGSRRARIPDATIVFYATTIKGHIVREGSFQTIVSRKGSPHVQS